MMWEHPFVRAVAFTGLAWLAFAPAERIWGHAHDDRPEWRADVGMATIGQLLVQWILAGVMAILYTALDGIALDEPLLAGVQPRPVRIALEIALGLVLFELLGYGYHRLAHRVPWMWRLHAVHHSAQRLDWLASFRQHPLEIVHVTLVQNIPLILLGLPLAAHATVLALLRFHTVFVHANLDLPPRAWMSLVASPRFHHRHHQRDGRVCNYSALFPWIDRLFGTHASQPAGPVGLPGDRDPRAQPWTLTGLMLAPFWAGVARDARATPTRELRSEPADRDVLEANVDTRGCSRELECDGGGRGLECETEITRELDPLRR